MTTEELKKEAEECMHNALFWLKLPISKENVEQGGSYILKLLEPREKHIAELEKENAELKEQNRNLLESCEGATMMYKDLCKAKGIIKKYLAIGVGGKITQNYLDVTKEAEQFLSEVNK